MIEISNEVREEVYLIRVKGEVDAGTSLELDNALKKPVESEHKRIVVDLTKLEYISSAGLGVFISHIDEFQANETKLVLFGINESVAQVFEILGLEKLLVIKETEKEAIEFLNEA